MSIRSQNRSQSITTPLMKVNQLVNSIYAINQNQLLDQLQTCSKIVAQLLQNQLINHLSSLGAMRLLCYELILLIAEENAVQNKPRLSLMENVFGNNKKIKFTASMRNTLSAISEHLEQMIWKNYSKKKGGSDKVIIENSPLYEGYVEFKQLLNEFDRHFDDNQDQIITNGVHSAERKKSSGNDSGQDQNQALIEQLQQIVAKKQKRIKQLNQQLQQNILQQKAQQDLITELQSRNIDLKSQLQILNQKLANKDSNELYLHQKIESLKMQALAAEKSQKLQKLEKLEKLEKQKQNAKKTQPKTQKTIKTKFTIDDDEEYPTAKKEYRDLFQGRDQGEGRGEARGDGRGKFGNLSMNLNMGMGVANGVCSECEARKDVSMEDLHNLRRMLLTQAISIQALI